MEYRKAKAKDIDSIFTLLRGAVDNMEAQGIHQWDEIYPARSDLENDIGSGTMFLAESEERLAGFYVLSPECDDAYRACTWENPDSTACVLHRFCVSADMQGKGIGRATLGHIEQQTRNMGYTSLRLDVFTLNPHAVRLYEKSGYALRGFADWRKGRFMLMEKVL